MSARLNFMGGIDEGHVFDAVTRQFPNHRIHRAAYAHTAVVTGAADVMVDAHNHIWEDFVSSAGGAMPRSPSPSTSGIRTDPPS
jgi:hypothetical protein